VVSKVDICNYALQELGAAPITSLNEGTPGALQCLLRYDASRRTLLTMHQWNFAIKRALLNADVETPAFNYKYQYTLPSDFLYMVMTGLEEQYQGSSPQVVHSSLYVSDVPNYGGIDKYRLEGNKLLSYIDSVNIVYVADVEDTQSFSWNFIQLLSRYLASQIAYRVTGSVDERNNQYKIFQEEFAEAVAIDSQQGTFDRIEVSKLLSELL
jgi:hypothetical protein